MGDSLVLQDLKMGGMGGVWSCGRLWDYWHKPPPSIQATKSYLSHYPRNIVIIITFELRPPYILSSLESEKSVYRELTNVLKVKHLFREGDLARWCW